MAVLLRFYTGLSFAVNFIPKGAATSFGVNLHVYFTLCIYSVVNFANVCKYFVE